MLLTEEQVNQKLQAFRGWEYKDGAITKTYRFSDFMTALDLVNKAAIVAEEVQHHPDILVRYSAVTFTLTTHDAGGVTEKDFALAKQIESLAALMM